MTIPTECTILDEELQLILETLGAHHFNLVLDQLGAGVHTVAVQARIFIATEFDTGAAEAKALVGKATAAASYFPALSVAMIYLGLGDVDAAFAWMERAVGESDPNVVGINTYPMLVPLHADPRFTALLHKMNLKP